MPWQKIQSVEDELAKLLSDIQNRPPGAPFDATEKCIDLGELMWRGLVKPYEGFYPDEEADAIVSGEVAHLAFSLTKAGMEAKKP